MKNAKKFAKLLGNADKNEDIVKITNDQSCEMDKGNIRRFKIADEMLESVAGGKNNNYDAGGSIKTTDNMYITISQDIKVKDSNKNFCKIKEENKMKNFKEFEERMHDEEFAKLFSNAETDEEIIKIAAEKGYEITKEDIQNFEMTDEMLESVAGGKNETYNAEGDITVYK